MLGAQGGQSYDHAYRRPMYVGRACAFPTAYSNVPGFALSFPRKRESISLNTLPPVVLGFLLSQE